MSELWTKHLGSGYPGITGYGVSGRGFPFWFWPVVWSDTAAERQPFPLKGTSRFSTATPAIRLVSAVRSKPHLSPTVPAQNTTFHVLSDNSTVTFSSNPSTRTARTTSLRRVRPRLRRLTRTLRMLRTRTSHSVLPRKQRRAQLDGTTTPQRSVATPTRPTQPLPSNMDM
ncbi:hypothetical protein EDD15DRAFT_2238329, partial [Pisolithus albus]